MPQKTCTRRAPLVGRVRADANPVAWTLARPVYKSVIRFPQNTPNRKPEVSAGHHPNCVDNTQIRQVVELWNYVTPLWNYRELPGRDRSGGSGGLLVAAAPFHGAVDLGDDAAPGDRGLLRAGLAKPPFGEHAAHPAVGDDAEGFVHVVQRRAGRERVEDRLELQRVPEVATDFGRLDEQLGLPGVVSAAQVRGHQVQFISVGFITGNGIRGDALLQIGVFLD